MVPSIVYFTEYSLVLIFPDYTSKVMAQSRAFKEVMQALHDRGIKYTLRYPAKLCVYLGEDGEPEVFLDLEKATKFLKKDTYGKESNPHTD